MIRDRSEMHRLGDWVGKMGQQSADKSTVQIVLLFCDFNYPMHLGRPNVECTGGCNIPLLSLVLNPSSPWE